MAHRAGTNFTRSKFWGIAPLCALVVSVSASRAQAETYTWDNLVNTDWDCGLFLCWSHPSFPFFSAFPPSFVPIEVVGRFAVGGTLSIPGGFTATASELTLTNSNILLHGKLDVSGTMVVGSLAEDFFSVAKFDQRAGHLIARDLLVTRNGGIDPGVVFNVQDGLLQSTNVTVGDKGNGYMSQLGGSIQVGTLVLGARVVGEQRGIGTFEMTGGTLSADIQYVGRDATGSFIHGAGSNTVADTLAMGAAASGQGSYQLTGASAVLLTRTQIVGYNGKGSFLQSNGTNTTTGDMYIAVNNGSVSTYTQIDGSNYAKGHLLIGFNGGSTGRYQMSGGSLTVDGKLYVGARGNGTFEHGGGTVRASATGQGIWIGSELAGHGSYALSGEGVVQSSQTVVAFDGVGVFEQTAGTHDVSGLLRLGWNLGSQGSYILFGGSLNVDGQVRMAENPGSIGNLVLNSGGTLSVNQISTGSGTSYLDLDGNGFHRNFRGSPMGIPDRQVSVTYLRVGAAHASNASLTLDGTYLTNETTVGDFGTGQVRHVAGQHLVSGGLFVGRASTGRGTYELRLGDLSATNQHIGFEGSGTFTQMAGNNSVAGTLFVGSMTGSDGSYRQLGGVASMAALSLGAGGNGAYHLNGGTLTVGAITVGGEQAGAGSFYQDGGVHNANDLKVGVRGTFIKVSGALVVNEGFANAGTTHLGGQGATDFRGTANNSGIVDVAGTAVNFRGDYIEEGHLHNRTDSLSFYGVTVNGNGYWTADNGAQFVMFGSFANGSTRGDLWHTSGASLAFRNHVDQYDLNDGEVPLTQNFGLAGVDLGANVSGFADNFSWHHMTVGSHVRPVVSQRFSEENELLRLGTHV